jgi:hypothetical protein
VMWAARPGNVFLLFFFSIFIFCFIFSIWIHIWIQYCLQIFVIMLIHSRFSILTIVSLFYLNSYLILDYLHIFELIQNNT